MASMFKKTDVKLELLTDPDMLLMIEKRIRGGICHKIFGYAKAYNKYMKDYNKDEEKSCLEHLDGHSLYRWAVPEPIPNNGFDWVEDLSKIYEDLLRNYGKDSDKGYILEVDVKYPKHFHDLHSDLPFLPERMNIDKCNKLVCNLHDKKTMLFI